MVARFREYVSEHEFKWDLFVEPPTYAGPYNFTIYKIVSFSILLTLEPLGSTKQQLPAILPYNASQPNLGLSSVYIYCINCRSYVHEQITSSWQQKSPMHTILVSGRKHFINLLRRVLNIRQLTANAESCSRTNGRWAAIKAPAERDLPNLNYSCTFAHDQNRSGKYIKSDIHRQNNAWSTDERSPQSITEYMRLKELLPLHIQHLMQLEIGRVQRQYTLLLH